MKQVIKLVVVFLMITVFIVMTVVCLSSCRETKVRVSYGRNKGKISTFVD